jgi:hypothetical protein
MPSIMTDQFGDIHDSLHPKPFPSQVYASASFPNSCFAKTKEVPDGAGQEPVVVDFSLKRGLWIDVQVTDKLTRKPVCCYIQHFAFLEDHPYLRQATGFRTPLADQPLAGKGIRFLWECLTSPAVNASPAPATSNGAGGFPALRSPVRFVPRVMRPIGLAALSAMVPDDERPVGSGVGC